MEYYSCKIYDSDVNKIISGVRVAECMALNIADEYEKEVEEDVVSKIQDLSVSSVLNCSFCNISFSDAIDQRNHYKLDWHRYNLKRALCDKAPVSEDVFDSLAGEISSISGSGSESSDGDSENENSNLLEKKEIEKFTSHKISRARHSKAFFENSDNQIFSLYKCLLHSKKDIVSTSSLITSINNLLNSPKKWLIVMLGGGHFAAAVFNNGVIAEHKTFHCYTVRAKQGGSQSTRDNKGGSHPKSAGASLRRYNEQALVQHVQEIMSNWSESVKQCQLILYRATGRYNRGVLFGGKNPPLEKCDPRLRNIPFPTRRATFKELKRVYDILCSVEVYGTSDEFKEKYPKSPDKRCSPRRINDKYIGDLGNAPENIESSKITLKKKNTPRKCDRSKPRSSPEREIPGENLQCVSDSSISEDEENDLLITSYVNIPLDELQEYKDTVPEHLKEVYARESSKSLKSSRKRKKKTKKSAFERQYQAMQKKLINCCEQRDKNLLVEVLNSYESLPDTVNEESRNMTKGDFIDCLNSSLSSDNNNTILHLSALNNLSEFIPLLLEAGADPTLKNKNRLTPYVLSGNKETKNSFKEFVSQYPDKIDCVKANIPMPLTEEKQKIYDEKKKERNRVKRQKDKIRKKENKEKREEEKERERFLALSDREKCALAAERRMLAAATANLKSAKPPVLSRCFYCGIDITGKVPFEYGTNRFCSIPCVKAHRLKTNSYGLEI